MRVLNDFTCEQCDSTDERFEDSAISQVICHTCGGTATKRIRPVTTVLDPISGSFPGATAKWLKHRDQRMKQERKNLDSHGTEK